MQQKNRDFFWPSYVDLLTVLFASVLVMFVLSYKLFQDREKQLRDDRDKFSVLAKEHERLQQIDNQIQALEQGGTFIYDSVYKRFLVKEFIGQEIFNQESDTIKDKYFQTALKAGQEIKSLVSSFYANTNISFVVLVEGNTAKTETGGIKGTVDGNYRLSYRRSLALINLWKEHGVDFGDRTELIIAGSGIYGIGRDAHEENNKRFLIQVIPKIKK